MKSLPDKYIYETRGNVVILDQSFELTFIILFCRLFYLSPYLNITENFTYRSSTSASVLSTAVALRQLK